MPINYSSIDNYLNKIVKTIIIRTKKRINYRQTIMLSATAVIGLGSNAKAKEFFVVTLLS